MTETRTFHIGDILTITTGKLVSPRHMDGVYDILNWMTGDSLFTHQLPRGMDECAPSLREQFPDLAAVVPGEDFGGSEQRVMAWLDAQVAEHGETREVTPLHEDEHTRIDPFTEMRKVAPQAEIIPVLVPETPEDKT
jgi:hypothetical protein